MQGTLPIITAATAICLAILQVILMLRTGFARGSMRIGLGDGGNEALLRRIRAHGNLAENAALVLVLLLLAEVLGASRQMLGAVATAFVLFRLGHAVAITQTSGPHPLRLLGALGTAATVIGLAVLIALRLI